MYKCESCKGQSKPGDSAIVKIVSTRKKSYENNVRHGKKVITIKSEGFETVREMKVCSACDKKPSA